MGDAAHYGARNGPNAAESEGVHPASRGDWETLFTGVFPFATNCSLEGVVVAVLALCGAVLLSYVPSQELPEWLRAGIIFILIVSLVGILLAYKARISKTRCFCAILLCSFVAGE
jgi:hypothetical protein